MTRSYKLLGVLFCVALCGLVDSAAASVHGTTLGLESPPLTGTRSTSDSNQLVGALDLAITWTITDNNDGTWHYQYVLSGDDAFRISHTTFQISPGAFADVLNAVMTIDYVIGLTPGALVFDPADIEGTDPTGPSWAASNVLKFDDGIEEALEVLGWDEDDDPTPTVTYDFDINRVAVWGNLFLKSGRGNTNNAGLDLEATSMDVNNFVAVPDSVTPTPEPASVLVWTALTGLILVYRRMR